MSRRLRLPDPGYWVAALLPLIGLLPTFGPGVIDTADGPLHVQRIFAMNVLLGSGQIWPRWVSYLHLGFGYPVFNYYPPGVFTLGGLLVRLGISATLAFNLVAALAWVIGSVGMYRLAKRLLPPPAALLAAMLWAYAPSRLFEVWDQGSLPQMMAAAWVPWLFAGILDAARKPTLRSILWVALPTVAITLSHQPITFITTLYAAPFALLAALWSSRNAWQSLWKRLGILLGGALLGAALAAAFLIPLALELRYVQASGGAEDNVEYLISNFLTPDEIFAQPPPADLTDLRFELPTTLGLIGGLLAVPGLIALAVRKQYGVLTALLLGLGFTLFMLVEASLDVWLGIPFFRQLRFPERFLRVGAVLIALAGGASLWLFPVRWRFWVLGPAMIAVLVAALPMVYPNKSFIGWENQTARDEIEFELKNATWGTTSYDEFDPIWGENIPLPQTGAPEMDAYETDPLRLVVNRVDMARYGDIMQAEQLSTDTVRVTLTQPHIVRFHQYYFPGWSAWLDGAPVELRADDEFGLILVDAPAGEHTIRLAYTGTTAQHIGGLVSALALLGFVVIFARTKAREEIIPEIRQPFEPGPALLIGGAVVAFALVNLFWITPSTRWFRLESPPDAPANMQTAVHASFGDTFELLGYTIVQETAAPGDIFRVMLFWRAQRPIDREYRPVAQLVNLTGSEAWAVSEPFFPGGGKTPGYPTDRFSSEIHEMRVNADAPPYVGRMLVQMVDAATGEPLALADGSTHLLLEPHIRVSGSGNPVQDTLHVRVADTAELRCADIEPTQDGYDITLGWHVFAAPTGSVQTFLHGLDADGETVTQGDGQPMAGQYPFGLWLPGQFLRDRYHLADHPDLTQIALGLYRPDTLERLPLSQNGTPLPDNRLILPLEGAPCLA